MTLLFWTYVLPLGGAADGVVRSQVGRCFNIDNCAVLVRHCNLRWSWFQRALPIRIESTGGTGCVLDDVRRQSDYVS